mmetsp:Transcript_21837/g.64429  ORF Transcript_21837/g.64429 Transcript_21837/m.64429 type:complete len:221 (+) Transcript_21837:972-1634(+)
MHSQTDTRCRVLPARRERHRPSGHQTRELSLHLRRRRRPDQDDRLWVRRPSRLRRGGRTPKRRRGHAPLHGPGGPAQGLRPILRRVECGDHRLHSPGGISPLQRSERRRYIRRRSGGTVPFPRDGLGRYFVGRQGFRLQGIEEGSEIENIGRGGVEARLGEEIRRARRGGGNVGRTGGGCRRGSSSSSGIGGTATGVGFKSIQTEHEPSCNQGQEYWKLT